MRFIRKFFYKQSEQYKRLDKSSPFYSASIYPLLYLLLPKRQLVAAEIGVYKAVSSIAMLSTLDIKKFYAIDLWRPYQEYLDKEKSVTTNDLKINDGDEVFKETQAKLLKFSSAEIIRNGSVNAASSIKDSSLDFCFIDANHEYRYVIDDINAYLPKMKKGAIFAGHDYHSKEVRDAVRDSLGKKGYQIFTEGYHFTGYPTCWYVITK